MRHGDALRSKQLAAWRSHWPGNFQLHQQVGEFKRVANAWMSGLGTGCHGDGISVPSDTQMNAHPVGWCCMRTGRTTPVDEASARAV
jgi:hypothetical protein